MVTMWVLLFFWVTLCFLPYDLIFVSPSLLLLRRPYFEMKAKYYLQLEVRDGRSAVI